MSTATVGSDGNITIRITVSTPPLKPSGLEVQLATEPRASGIERSTDATGQVHTSTRREPEDLIVTVTATTPTSTV
jgi:hypothetical protein